MLLLIESQCNANSLSLGIYLAVLYFSFYSAKAYRAKINIFEVLLVKANNTVPFSEPV